MTSGFKQAGFRTLAAIENDPTCVECLKENFADIKVYGEDVRLVTGKRLMHDLGLKRGELDVVCGGPPCQGFSMIGLRDPKDPRCGLIFEFYRLVSELKPKFFVMENVPGMLSAHKGKFVEDLVHLLEADGYVVVKPLRVLNSAHFGVPQKRKRVFIVGVRKDLKVGFNYPIQTHFLPEEFEKLKANLPPSEFAKLKPTPTIRDAIADLPIVEDYPHLIESDSTAYTKRPVSLYAKMMRGVVSDESSKAAIPKGWDSKVCTGCRRTLHGQTLKKRCATTPAGQNIPVSRLFKLGWDGVSNTLRAGTPRERGAYSSPRPIHPEQPRVITVREGARIQSFPDWHRFHPTKWHGFRQVGNAVPPLLARAVASAVLKSLKTL